MFYLQRAKVDVTVQLRLRRSGRLGEQDLVKSIETLGCLSLEETGQLHMDRTLLGAIHPPPILGWV